MSEKPVLSFTIYDVGEDDGGVVYAHNHPDFKAVEVSELTLKTVDDVKDAIAAIASAAVEVFDCEKELDEFWNQ